MVQLLMFQGELSGLLTNFYWSNQHTVQNDWPEGFLSVRALPLELGSI